ncbi:MAG: di-heme oxidoredictase family protein [Hyphomicrobiaceae bacterium]
MIQHGGIAPAPTCGRHFKRLLILFSALVALVPSAAPADEGLDRAVGKALFDRQWVPAPSSTKANDGLGPLFNARSCAQCHSAATAGRIEIMPDKRLLSRGSVVRLSRPDGSGDPHYGRQIQTHAIPGFGSEAEALLDWRVESLALRDGSHIELRQSKPALAGLETPLAKETSQTLLLAPSLKVAARIDKVDLEALGRDAQPNSKGRLLRDAQGRILIFGRKATEGDLEGAIALAFSRDLGLSTRQYPEPSGDCTPEQTKCREAINGADASGVEIAKEIVDAIAAYVRGLDTAYTPPIKDGSAGAGVMSQIGCDSCHAPSLPAKGGGEISLFSDLRLHDLGDGLAGLAESNGQRPSEWRTAPLLGLGERLRAGATLLHDGRARNIDEAVLWHGGDAKDARERYESLSPDQRHALERYLLGE